MKLCDDAGAQYGEFNTHIFIVNHSDDVINPFSALRIVNMISRLPNSGDVTKKITGDWLKHSICWYFRVRDKR